MARPIKKLKASAADVAELRRRAKAATSPHRDRLRAEIILLRLEGMKNAAVAERLGASAPRRH